MKLYEYYVLSGIKFITVEDFSNMKLGDKLNVHYHNQTYSLTITKIDTVQNFRPKFISNNDFVCFSNFDADKFMLATI